MIPDPIPPQVDLEMIVSDLVAWGWRDSKIEIRCGLGQGYIAQLRCGNIKAPAYDKAARIFNFWRDELEVRTARIAFPVEHLQTRIEVATST